MSIRRLPIAALAALLLSLPPAIADAAPAATASAASAPGVRLRASLPGGRLGAETPIRLGLSVDPRIVKSPVRVLRLKFPAALPVATSGLGAETCARTTAEFADVMIYGYGLAGCHPNAVMGRGTARAEVWLGSRERSRALVIPELARVAMLAAPFRDDRFGLLFLANGLRPFGVTLAYDGRIERAPAPFGGMLVMDVPPMPNSFDATVALTAIQFEIGSPQIRYREVRGDRAVSYKPEGVVLPPRCPRAGFPFAADLTLADGRRVRATTRAVCPSR